MVVRYTKNRGERPYKQRFKGFRDVHALTDLVARLKPKEFESLKRYARHFLGSDPIPGLPSTHSEKIKPSAYKKIVKTKYPAELTAAVFGEEEKHDDPSLEYHKGGGLGSALSSLVSVAWDQFKADPMVEWLADKIFPPLQGDELSESDQYNADVLREAYKDMDNRASKMHGWLHLPKYDSAYAVVYYNPAAKQVHVGVRGSQSSYDWLYHNTQIVTGNKAGWELSSLVRGYLMEVSTDFPNNDITVIGHSLSGTLVKDAFVDASPQQTKVLDNIDSILLANPGSSPFGDQSSITSIMEDPRVRLFLNKSDLINQGFVQNLNEDSNFVFGPPTQNILTAHGYDQYTSDDPQYDKEVEWGPAPFTQGAENTWKVGEHTSEAFDAFADDVDTNL